MTKTASKVSAAQMNTFFAAAFHGDPARIPAFIEVYADHITMSATMTDADLRPGGYVKGPTQMMLADHAAYAVIFTRLGITPMAVTTNLNIDFLSPLITDTVIVDAKTIKIGRNLAVLSVEMRAKGKDRLASRATVTYALPQG